MADQPRGRGRGGPRGGGRGRGGQGGSFPPGGGGEGYRGGRGGGEGYRGGRGGGESYRGGRGGGEGFRGGGGGRGGGGRGGQGGSFPPGGGGEGYRGGRGGGEGFRGGGGRGRGGGYGGGPAIYSGRNNQCPQPDGAVMTLENARQKARQNELNLSSLSLTNTMPARPGYGNKGNQIKVWANYVEMTPKPSLVLYSYDVATITPEVTGKKRIQLIRLLMAEAPELANYRNDIVSDFKAIIISRKDLQLPEGQQRINVVYRAEGEDVPKARATTYTVVCKFTKTLYAQNLIEYLTSTDLSVVGQYDSKLEMVQALNIFLKHYVKSANNLATIGASKSFSTSGTADSFDLGSGLKAIRGFFTSVRAATNRILVNVNVSHGAFYQGGELARLMTAYGFNQGNSRSLGSLEKFLKRIRVRTTHLKAKTNKQGIEIPRIKTIYGLASKKSWKMKYPPIVEKFGAGPKQVQFWLNDDAPSAAKTPSVPGAEPSQSTPKKKGKGKGKGKGAASGSGPAGGGPASEQSDAGRYISVFDFFTKNYGTKMDPNYPVVNVGTADHPSYLPVEVCVVMDGQACNTKLTPNQTSNMIKFAVRKPGQNAFSIVQNGLETAGLTASNEILAKFGVSIGQDLITVPARVLPEPAVLYAKGTALRVESGSWNMRNVKMHKSGTLNKWSWILIEAGKPTYGVDYNAVSENMKKFETAMRTNGVMVSPALQGRKVDLQYDTDPTLESVFKDAANKGLELLFIVLPYESSALYNYIKTLGEIKYGLRTQCVIGSKFMNPRGQPMYFANVALKVNLKVGGHNHLVEQDRLSFIADDKTMLVGIDVTHPSPGSSASAPSVATMVASIDKHLGQWPGVLRIQGARQEMVADIKDMFKSRLTMWRQMGRHASLPDNILVYRDGVSEGQYQLVLDNELAQMREACTEMYPADLQKKNLPRITLVVVGKRHHTRFYPCSAEDGDRNGNCRQGTVVDRGVTEEGSWDCFLQSHSVIQGTGRPAHYYVILDEIFRSRSKFLRQPSEHAANELEKVTQALCYVFGRATKAVSICTPAYYADILCERARRYLADVFEGSDTASTVGEGSSTAGGSVDRNDARAKIIAKLENTMYYI